MSNKKICPTCKRSHDPLQPCPHCRGLNTCNRRACQKSITEAERWWNTSTRSYYCKECADNINSFFPGLLHKEGP